jgi:hypothetical protein
MKKELFAILMLFGCCLSLNASHKKSPVPESVTSAKTIYVVNGTEFESVGDTAYEELGKWGHYQVVHDSKSADLILHFFEVTREGASGASTFEVNMFATAGDSGDRLFQSGNHFSLTASSMVRKDIDEFRKWVDGK